MANSLVVRKGTDLAKRIRALRAAQYVRMSTDFQRYSIQNQAATIAACALQKQTSRIHKPTTLVSFGLSVPLSLHGRRHDSVARRSRQTSAGKASGSGRQTRLPRHFFRAVGRIERREGWSLQPGRAHIGAQ